MGITQHILHLRKIDIRCYLANKSPEQVTIRYFEAARKLERYPKFFEPVRQSSVAPNNVDSPQRGTISQGVKIHNIFLNNLIELSKNNVASQVAGDYYQGASHSNKEDGYRLSRERNS